MSRKDVFFKLARIFVVSGKEQLDIDKFPRFRTRFDSFSKAYVKIWRKQMTNINRLKFERWITVSALCCCKYLMLATGHGCNLTLKLCPQEANLKDLQLTAVSSKVHNCHPLLAKIDQDKWLFMTFVNCNRALLETRVRFLILKPRETKLETELFHHFNHSSGMWRDLHLTNIRYISIRKPVESKLSHLAQRNTRTRHNKLNRLEVF